MAQSSYGIEVYLETGKKRTFAGALAWPGWCRSGQDGSSALQTLSAYGLRYAEVPRLAQLEFQSPADASGFTVVERLPGDVSTDFGAPGKPPSSDAAPVDDAELMRLQALLKGCWQVLDAARHKAEGKELSTGPRGGGRSLEKMTLHVLEADAAYLSRLGVKWKTIPNLPLDEALDQCRRTILEGLAARVHGELPAQGLRGGAYWTARYFVRRSAWHVLDHAWELEDRIP